MNNKIQRKFNTRLLLLIVILPIAIVASICALIFGFSRDEVWKQISFWDNSSSLSQESTIRASIESKDNITIQLEVARTSEQQEKGLMYRQSLEENSGMLFIFDHPQPLAFWMKNTYIPLDIAFLDQNKKVINIEAKAEPLDTTKLYKSKNSALYAVEMNAGWFEKNNVREGDMFKFIID